jgi:L-iditol 2-dehydrogenase
MKALVKTQKGKGFLEIREVPEPTIGPKDVLIKVKAAGICGTDIHIRDDGFPYNPPVIIGHEFSGEIVDVGVDVEGYSIGDRVVAEPHRGGCGVCRYCLTGQVEVCRQKKAIGYRVDGAFAPLLSLPVSSLHRIPANVSFEQAALCEPLAVSVKAVLERSKVEPQDFVVVLGCGPVGLLAAAAAKAAGAKAVLVSGTSRDEKLRLPAARAMGMDYTVNIQSEDLLARVMELTKGTGADLVVEASGAEPAIRQAMELVKIDGRITGLGITGKDLVSIPYDMALKKAVHLDWSMSSSWTSWEKAVALLGSGKINVQPLISGTYSLLEWEKSFEKIEALEAIKILLVP